MAAWIKRHPLAALGLLALALRVAAAVVTEIDPIFPPYYYTDARVFHEAAAAALDDKEHGRPPVFKGPRSVRVVAYGVYGLYKLTGPRPLAAKLANAALGAAGVVTFAWMLTLAFEPSAALISGLLVALWPTHVFYTSQNLKEAPSILLSYAALACAMAAWAPSARSRGRRLVLAAGAIIAMLGAGFFRPPVLAALALSLAAASSAALLRDAERRRPALGALAALAAALALYSWLSRGTDAYEYQLLPAATPETLTKYRDVQEMVGREMALNLNHRETGTPIFPDAKFSTWTDVFLYIPKGTFYVLFMPLPGVYPMEGKLGRLAASAENFILLFIVGFAVARILRDRFSPERLCLLAFFATLLVGAALLELDLGGAGRHKLLYLPMLFPFAAEEVLRLYYES